METNETTCVGACDSAIGTGCKPRVCQRLAEVALSCKQQDSPSRTTTLDCSQHSGDNHRALQLGGVCIDG